MKRIRIGAALAGGVFALALGASGLAVAQSGSDSEASDLEPSDKAVEAAMTTPITNGRGSTWSLVATLIAMGATKTVAAALDIG